MTVTLEIGYFGETEKINGKLAQDELRIQSQKLRYFQMIRENIATKKKRNASCGTQMGPLGGNPKQGVSSGNHNIQQSKFQREKRQEHCSGEKKKKTCMYFISRVMFFFYCVCVLQDIL